MARQQYFIAGELKWQSNSGNALFAILNPVGSNKKLTIGSVQLTPLTSTKTATAGSVPVAPSTQARLSRGTAVTGAVVVPEPMDTDAGNLPAGIVVSTGGGFAETSIVRQFSLNKLMATAPTTLSWGMMSRPYGLGRMHGKRKDSQTESIIIRAGESVALRVSNMQNSMPVRVSAIIVKQGSPARSYTVSFNTNLQADDQPLLLVENQTGSGEVIELRMVSVEEMGTYDSPYFQLVPVGGLNADSAQDAQALLPIGKMDTAYPDPTTFIKAYADVQIFPFGQPESAFAEGSAGSPKGFNYLKTKDFIGTVYRTNFPEGVAHNRALAVLPDQMYARSQRGSDMGIIGSGITVREGEGIALVSGAETAIVTSAVGVSGWSSFTLSAIITVEPKLTPVLTLTGLEPATNVIVYEAGTANVVASETNIVDGTFTTEFDPDVTPFVDIFVLSLDWFNVRLYNQGLSLADQTIPIIQSEDTPYTP